MMNSLLKSIGTVRSGDSLLKESLRSHLIISVKEVQLEFAQAPQNLSQQGKNDASNSFCTVLEAVFLHGLRETFADRMALALADPDQRPEPSFWSPLLVFSHRQIIDQIGELTLVTTDIGRCRAWLRVAINDCLLSSYLQSMILQNDALKSYYKPSAYLRDIDLLDVTKQLVEGIEACEFEFACNSSLLNTWTNPPLLMAGLWTPPMKSFPVSSGTDIARTLATDEDNTKIDDIISVASYMSYQDSLPSSSQSVLFDEEEALKIILGKQDEVLPEPKIETLKKQEEKINECLEINAEENKEDSKIYVVIENSVASTDGLGDEWSSLPAEVDDSNFLIDSSFVNDVAIPPIKNKSVSNISKLQSYHSLVESYNQGSTTGKTTPDLNDFIQKFQCLTSNNIPDPSLDIGNEQVAELGFEILCGTSPRSFNVSEFSQIVHQLGCLPLELGLDSQNYTCKSCSQNIGISFNSIARVCSLTGSYYCEECFDKAGYSEEWVIPARIIHNWDFRRHPVCSKAANFLDQIQYHPLIDIEARNPRIYFAVEEMSHLQDLRIRLNFLHAYLQLCREPVIEELQKKVWPREYLYEHIHLYSISDLIEIPSGALAQQLQNAVNYAHRHVISCWLCSQKGFICEICGDKKVIYPFDLESTYRCDVCSSLFHASCLNAFKPCPKCKRRSERDLYLQPEETS